ncbi:MAG: hypothetical protein KAS53_07780 [Candidatus Cloacimonetes bacterium]|nr:hypothetical protein [Candidatus Cloacimonadota bacterium]
MKKTKILTYTLSVLILLIVSCTDSTEPDENAKINGQVTNSLGEPISDAKIMLTYYTESIATRPLTTFSYDLTDSLHIKLWITYHNVSDTVKVLIDEYLEPGNYSVQWDSTNSYGLIEVSNYYDWHIKMGTNQIDDKLLLNVTYSDITSDDVNKYECFAMTDGNGHYDFEIDKLPFSFSDNEIEITDEYGNVIDIVKVSRTVKIWALHTDYDPVFIDSVYINENSITEGNLSFD